MADYTTAAIADAIAHVHLTHPESSTITSITPTAGAIGAYIHMHHGFIEATTNTNPGSFYVQTNLGTTNESWVTKRQFTVTDGLPVIENLDATEGVGETTLALADEIGFVAGDYIYVEDVNTAANSEWHQVDFVVVNTSVDLVVGLVTEKDTADNIISLAENFHMWLPLAGVVRWRVIYKAEGATGANVAIWVRYVEVTDFE